MIRRMRWLFPICLFLIVLPLLVSAAGDGTTVYRAMLIGVDAYQNNPLSGCVTDATRMAKVLQAANDAGAFYQTPTIRSNLQTDEISALLKEAQTLGADDDDVTFFYFAGHGFLSDKGTPAIVGKDTKMLALRDVREALDKVPGVKVVVLDTRYADSLLTKAMSVREALGQFDKAVVDEFETAQTALNYYVLSSSTLMSDEAKALPEDQEPRGLVSVLLAQGCGYDYAAQKPTDDLPADVNGNGAVSLTEARDYIEQGIKQLKNADALSVDVQIAPENSAYPVFAKRATAEVLEVTLEQGDVAVPAGRTRKLEAKTQPANASARSITWTSSDLSIATVDDDGVISGVRPGTVKIAATTANGLTVVKEVAVRDVKFVDSIELNISRLSVAPGAKLQLVANVTPSFANEALKWTSDNEGVATVDNEGNVSCMALGETFVTVSSENGVEATCAIKIVNQDQVVTQLKLKNESFIIYSGESRQIDYQIKPEKAADPLVEFASDNPEVAKVDSAGVLTGVAEGTCVVTATASSGTVAQARVTVKPASLELNPASAALKVGKSAQIKTKINPATLDGALTWVSSDPEVVRVENGKITGLKDGEATITASVADIEASCKVLVGGAVVKGIQVKPKQLKLKTGAQQQLAIRVMPEKAAASGVVYTSNNEQVALVDNTGNITAVGPGRAIITVKAQNKKAKCLVMVKGAAIDAEPTAQQDPGSRQSTSGTASTGTAATGSELTLVAGLAGQNKASLAPSMDGTAKLKWKSSNPRVAVVDQSGNVTAKAAGKAIIKSSGQNPVTVKVTVVGNYTNVDKPEIGEDPEVYVGLKRAYYRKGYLAIDLYFVNKTSAAVEVPTKGTLVLTLADGTLQEVKEITASGKKLKAGQSGVLSFKVKVASGDRLFGLDLRGAQAAILENGAAIPDDAPLGVEPSADVDLAGDAEPLD